MANNNGYGAALYERNLDRESNIDQNLEKVGKKMNYALQSKSTRSPIDNVAISYFQTLCESGDWSAIDFQPKMPP